MESRGGFDRRLEIRLKSCEVRILADVGDQGVGEQPGEVLDESGWECGIARGGRRGAARLIERVDLSQWASTSSEGLVLGPGMPDGWHRNRSRGTGASTAASAGAPGFMYRTYDASLYATVRRRLRIIWSRIHRTWEAGSIR